MGNKTFNRGPKTPLGRLNSLRNLRGVRDKIFRDKGYAEEILKVGMNYKSQKDKRKASKISNQYDKVFNKLMIKPKSPDIEALKEWKEELAKNSDMSLEEAVELKKELDSKKTPPNHFVERPAVRRVYGLGIHDPRTVRPNWKPIGSSAVDRRPKTSKNYY